MNKKLEFEGNIIEIVKTEKGYEARLTINKNVDVYINQECVYSEYENEAYKYVPANMRDFIKENAYSVEFNNGGDIDGSCAEVNVAGDDITMYFPKNKTKKIYARYTITDPLDVVLYLVEEHKHNNKEELAVVKEKITNIYYTMLGGLKNLGFELEYSHSMCESFWGWHDLTFKPSEFDEEKFIKASKIIYKYDSDFCMLAKEYKWI